MEKLELKNLTVNSARSYSFYLIPRDIIDKPAFDGIDYGSKILYALMLGRASISSRNPEYIDENGDVFIIYRIEQIQEDMRCSNKTAIKMLEQLHEIGLVEKQRRGQGKPAIIYVKDFSSVHFKECTSYTSRSEESTFQEVYNLHFLHKNKNNLSKNNPNKSDRKSETPEESGEEEDDDTLLKKVDYEAVKELYNKHCPRLMKCRNLNESRRKAIEARQEEFIRGGAASASDKFVELFEKANRSDYLAGEYINPKTNKPIYADFDYVLSDEKYVKILEGYYDNRPERAEADVNGSDSSFVTDEFYGKAVKRAPGDICASGGHISTDSS